MVAGAICTVEPVLVPGLLLVVLEIDPLVAPKVLTRAPALAPFPPGTSATKVNS